MKAKIVIELGNAAFVDNADELPTLLETVARKIGELSYDQYSGYIEPIIDSNGNHCGEIVIS